MTALTVRERPVMLRPFAGRTTLFTGLAILGTVVLISLAAPLVAPYDPIYQDGASRLAAPSWVHPFGTDNFGRDILSRVIWSGRVDLQIAFLGVVFPFLIGTTIGTISGYFGGLVDAIFMRVVDVVLAFPYLVLIIAIIAILGPGLKSFYIAL
ncbi:MAG: ABC transporter permease, partial [Cypionkella sp.]